MNAEVAQLLLQQLQQPDQPPAVLQQLRDLSQHCDLMQHSGADASNAAETAAEAAGMYGSSSSDGSSRAAVVLSVIPLLAQQLADKAMQTAAVDQDSDTPPPHNAHGVVLAWFALLLLSNLSVPAVQQQYRSLTESDQLQLHQAMAMLLQQLAPLADVMQHKGAAAATHAGDHSSSSSRQRHGKRPRDVRDQGVDTAEVASCDWTHNSSTCSAASTTQSVWLAALHKGLSRTISGAAAGCALAASNLLDLSWLEAVPTLYTLMREPTLSFLWGAVQQLRQQQKQQHAGIARSSELDHYVSATSRLYSRLEILNPHITSNAQLLDAAIALAPGLPGLLHLMELPQLAQHRNQAYGAAAHASWRLNAALQAAMKAATTLDLLQCWANMPAVLQTRFRARMQDAVVASLLDGGQPVSCSTSSTADLILSELLYGSLFEGPKQLLQSLMQPGRHSTTYWPELVVYRLVPAALQQLLEQQPTQHGDSGQQQAGLNGQQQTVGALTPGTAPGNGTGTSSESAASQHEDCQPQQQQQSQLDEDIIRLVTQWLHHVDHAAAGVGAATAGASTTAVSGNSSYLLQLFCSAEALLRKCAADTWGLSALQQLMQGAEVLQSALYQPAAPGGQVNRPSLLQYVLHVVAQVLQQKLGGSQFALVFSIAGPLARSGCCMLLQQLFIRQLAPLSPTAVPAEATRKHASASNTIAGPARVLWSTATNNNDAGNLHRDLQSRMSSSWESADLLVSAVLGCQPGAQGLNTLWGSYHINRPAQHIVGAVGVWQPVHSRHKRRTEGHAAVQPTVDGGDSQGTTTWLQEQVLLLLADSLLHPEPVGSSQQCPATVGSSEGATSLTLMRDTDDLLVGHPLWLKLLLASSSCQSQYKDIATAVSAGLSKHAAVQQAASIASHLCNHVARGQFAVGQLQHYQYHQQALSMLAVVAQPCMSAADIAISLEQAAIAVQQFNIQQQLLGDFYTILCPMLGGIVDLHSYTSDLECLASQLQSFLAADLNNSSLWGKHEAVLHAAESVAPVLHTVPFTNSVCLHSKQLVAATAGVADDPAVAEAHAAAPVDWSTTGLPMGGDGRASMTVSETCQTLTSVVGDFADRWTAATRAVSATSSQGSRESPTVAEVLALWVSDTLPTPEAVAADYQQIEDYFKAKQQSSANSSGSTIHMSQQLVVSAEAVSALLRLYHSSKECVWSQQLAELQDVFQLQDSPLLQAMQQLPDSGLLEVQAPAVLLADAFVEIEQQLGVLAGHHELLVQLGRSAGLQEFLATTGSDDLRRLTDGAEDQGDGFLRSSVISDLLEVNRLLQQLRTVHGAATLEQLLHRIVHVATGNARQAILHSNRSGAAAASQVASPSSAAAGTDASRVPAAAIDAACSRLTAQLRSCIEYLHGFKALYSRLANRAELTGEVVTSVVQRGSYHFETVPYAAGATANSPTLHSSNNSVVMAYCSYPAAHASSAQTSRAAAAVSTMSCRQLSILELQELRSCVMLLASSNSSQPQNSPTTGEDMLALFVQEVGLAAEITDTVRQLLDVGCFSYSSWQQQLHASGAMQQRLMHLQQLQEQLQRDLDAWRHQLAVAQVRCKWLNYFEPQQLFILRHFLCTTPPTVDDVTIIEDGQDLSDCYRTEQQLSAMALLQFVQPDLQLEQAEAVIAACPASPGDSTAIFAAERAGSPALRLAICSLYQLQHILDRMFSNHNAAAVHAAAQSEAQVATSSTGPAAAADASIVKVVMTDSSGSSMAALLQAHNNSMCHQALQASDVVFCSGNTSWWQVKLLLQRCFPWLAWHSAQLSIDASGASASGSQQLATAMSQQLAHVRLHALCDVDKLPLELQTKLLQLLQLVAGQTEGGIGPQHSQLLLTSNNSSCLLVSSLLQAAAVAAEEDNTDSPAQVIEVAKLQHAANNSEAAASMSVHMQRQKCSVVILTSDLPGQGKSTTAAKLAAAQGKQLYHVLLVDDMSPPCDVICQLRAWNPQQQVLHLQLLSCSSPAAVEQVLCSFLVLGHLSNGPVVYHRPQGSCSVIIEVGNSLGERLLQQLPLLGAAEQQQGLQLLQFSSTAAAAELAAGSGELLKPGYRRLHCTFKPEHVDTSAPDMQLLCSYLSLNEEGVLDRVSVGEAGEIDQHYHQYTPSAAANRQLLQRAFIAGRESVMSYTLLNTFVSVAARQLRHMSGSCFFMPETLQYAFGGAACTVRSQLLQAITAAAASFAVESCSAVRNRQHQQQQLASSTTDAGLQLAARMGSVIRWSDSNHLLLLFNSADDHQTITPLYRLPQHVPATFQQLLATQVLRSEGQRGGLLDYAAINHYQLLQILLQLVQQLDRGNACDSSSWDASLVSEIAAKSGVRQVWLFLDESNTCEHQGLLASIISHRQLPGGRYLHPQVIPMAAVNPYRLKPGLTQTSSGASTVAATAGLRSKLPAAHTGLARLVYSVQPSPEALLDHVSDYGTLSKTDEAAYIQAMVAQAAYSGTDSRNILPERLIVDLLCTSQSHTRACGYDWDVSLRDVSRCLRLARWFEGNMRNRPKPKRKHSSHWGSSAVLGGYYRYLMVSEEEQQQTAERRERANVQLQALVLALMHTYLSRLSSREDRQQYLQLLVAAFRAHGKTTTVRELVNILEAEQQDYLKRMELPAGIAVNEALRENVFTALVCILNKIPLFLVGKPGSSKSLALRLIHANLRGPDSSDNFFRQLPALLFYSYQGSESSTSKGIHKVFGEAKKAAAAAGSGTIAVVLLDEVGLAEISPHNPLKALHALLEPGYPAQLPGVAVVGISNWALDAAKMSRAVVLSRPEPELDDLTNTAITIWQDAHNTAPDAAKRHTLQEVARAYFHHYHNQTVQDFHGLRDYYALIRTLRLQPQLSPEQLYRALARNFGGPAELMQQVMTSFSQHVVRPPGGCLPTVDELVKDNLLDHTARHLLLISTGDLAVEVVHSCLVHTNLGQAASSSGVVPNQQVAVLWGSPWPGDQSEAYKYSMLSEIILRMELGHKLILRDCGIFGALYDMLNQNYSTVGGRNNCRTALGAHSNPMCTVHHDFKAVVVMDPAQAAAADPSLLNRFEKQWLHYRQLLPVSYQKLLLEALEHWVQQLASAAAGLSSIAAPQAAFSSSNSIGSDGAAFAAQDLFLGHLSDSMASLLVRFRNQQMRQQPAHSVADLQVQQWLMKQCQQELLSVCSLDGVARASCSAAGSTVAAPVQQLVTSYLQAPTRSINDFVAHQTVLWQQQQQQARSGLNDPAGSSSNTAATADVSLWYVMTRSGFHVTVRALLRQVADVHEVFTSQVKSEQELRHQLQSFLSSSSPSQPVSEPTNANSTSEERLQLFVFHATAEAAAELRHFRHLVMECVTAAGLRPATAALQEATAAGSASPPDSADLVEDMQKEQDQTDLHTSEAPRAPMLAVMVVVHLPIAVAAAHAAARLRDAADLPAFGSNRSASTASSHEHSWQCSWLSTWQQVTVDSLEGYKPWVWEVLQHCMTAAAAADTAAASPCAAVTAVPLPQLMGSALVEALSALPYPRTAAAAERVRDISEQLLSTAGMGLWGILQQLVQERLQAWPGWQQQRLLQLASDVLQLQLHGSFPAAVEASLIEEVGVQLTQMLLGLEQHQVLDAYWQATNDVQQVVHKLLCDGQLAPKGPQAACHALPTALQLQLPVSQWCHHRLQGIRADCAQLLHGAVVQHAGQTNTALDSKDQDQDVEMVDMSGELPAAGDNREALSYSAAGYQLDTLLVAAVGEGMAMLLKQHAAACSSDLLLLTLAAEAEDTTRSPVLPMGLVSQLLQVIGCSSAEHHPLQVQLLAWQHQPQLTAFAHVLSSCTCSGQPAVDAAHMLGVHELAHSSSADVVDKVVMLLYQAQLPTESKLEAAGGVAAWHHSSKVAVAQAQALLPLGLDSSSLVLLENLEALVQLVGAAEAAVAEPAAAGAGTSDVDQLSQLLGLLSKQLQDGTRATTNAAVLGELFGVVSQLGDNTASSAGANPQQTQQVQQDMSKHALTTYKSWLLSRSVLALAANPTLLSPTPACACAAAAETENLAPSPLLLLIIRQLLGSSCSSALLHPMVQLLQLSVYHQQGWKLLEDVQLLGQQHSVCPVLHCIHTMLTETGCSVDSTPMALVSLAVQQCCFSGSSFMGSGHAAQAAQAAHATYVRPLSDAEAVRAATWVGTAAQLLCQDKPAPLQLAVVVAFLRSVIDASAPAGAALATTAATAGTKRAQQQAAAAAAAAKAYTPVLTALDAVLVGAAAHTQLHSLFMYMLKAMKGVKSVSKLQQMIADIAQQPTHPLNQCMAALSARLSATTQEQQLQRRLPPDPYTGMPKYQQLTQLLLEAAAWPESAAELLRNSLREAGKSQEVAKAWLAVLCRHVYLPQLCASGNLHSASPAATGLVNVVKQLPALLKESVADPFTQKLMLALVQQTWGRSGSSNSSGMRHQSLLQLTAGATEQQLYICCAMVHLATTLTACRTAGQNAAARPSSSSTAAASPDATGLVAPLLTYLTNPAAAKTQYVLGMPGDEAAQLLNMRELGGTTVYRCACGMAYLVGNCGQPVEKAKCPSAGCKYSIGGSYGLAAGQVQVASVGQVQQKQQTGFISMLVSGEATSSSGLASGSGPALAAAASSGVRDLPPSSCHLLRLLVHASLAAGAAAGLQPNGALHSLVGMADEAAQQLVEAVVVQQWQLLRRSMQATDEQVLAVVLCTIDTLTSAGSRVSSRQWDLSSTVDRQQLEGLFQQQVAAQWTRNPHTALQHLLAARQTTDDTNEPVSSTYLACAVQEGLVRGLATQHNSRHLLTLFRSVAVPTLDALAAQFWSAPENTARYPVTHAVLLEQQQQRMSLVPHLLHLVEFEAVIRQSLSHTIGRTAARSTTLNSQLQHMMSSGTGLSAAAADQQPAGPQSNWLVAAAPAGDEAVGSATTPAEPDSSKSSNTAGSMRPPWPAKQLQHFIESWNAVRQVTTRLECRDVVVPELSPATACLTFACLTSSDEGMYLLAMLTELANQHNAFLRLAAQQQQQQEQEPTAAQMQQQLPTKAVQLIKQSDMIDVAAVVQHLQSLLALPRYEGLAYPGLDYGAGQTPRFDLAAVERLLHGELVAGKCLLDASIDSLQQFVFKGEVFRRSATLLHQADSKVPQLQPSLAGSSELAAALQHQLPPGTTATSVLPHLEVLMSFMVKTGGSTSSTVASYAAAWLPEGPTRDLLTSLPFMQQLQLQQVVGLYEGLEDAIAAAVGIEDCCSAVYRGPPDLQLQQEVLRVVGARVGSSNRTTAASSSKLPRQPASSTAVQGSKHQSKQAATAASSNSIPAGIMISMLRRVILRFLCGAQAAAQDSADPVVQPDTPLSVYCCNFDCCRWPWPDMGCADRQAAEQLVEQLFPDSLQVAHVAYVVKMLRQ